MPRWVEHESDDDTASTSGEDEEQLGQAPPQIAAKRKAASPEAGPSSNKKLKLSISLSRAKQECHVRQLSHLRNFYYSFRGFVLASLCFPGHKCKQQ